MMIKKRILSLLGVFALALSLFPTTALAVDDFSLGLRATPSAHTMTTLRAGDTVRVEVLLPAKEVEVFSLQAKLNFDTKYFSCKEINYDGLGGSYFGGMTTPVVVPPMAGWGVMESSTVDTANENGFIMPAYATYKNSAGQQANGTLGSTAEAKAAFYATFQVKADVNGKVTPFSISNIEIKKLESDGVTTNAYTVGTPAPISATVVQELSSVSLTGSIAAPVKNATDTSAVNGENVEASVVWNPALVDNKFAAGISYQVTVTVTPNNGYLFTDSSTVTLADSDLTFTLNPDGNFVATKNFDKTADKELTGLTIKTNPTKMSYVDGDTLDTTGLVLTATYDDGSVEDITSGFTVTGTLSRNQTEATVSYGGKTVTISGLTVDRAVAIAKSVTVSGGSTNMMVPADKSVDSKSEVFTVAVTDQYEETINSPTVEWSIKTKDGDKTVNGVSIENGVVSVTNAAKNTITNTDGMVFVVTAKCGEATDTKEITIKRDSSKIAEIEVSGVGEIIVPDKSATEDATAQFTVAAKDQYGADISDPSVTWSIIRNGITEPVTGVSIDQSGKVTVTKAAKDHVGVNDNNSFYVRAASSANPEVFGAKDVDVKRAASVVTSMTVAAADATNNFVVPAGTEAMAINLTISEIKDQYGDSIRLSEAVQWTAIDGVEFTQASESNDFSSYVANINTAKMLARFGGEQRDKESVKITFTAKYDNTEQCTDVTFTLASAEPTSIVLTSNPTGDDIVIPTGDTPNTKTYTATVKDQYGFAMNDAKVTYKMTSGDEKVAFNDATATVGVAEGAKADQSYTVTATCGTATASHTFTVKNKKLHAGELDVAQANFTYSESGKLNPSATLDGNKVTASYTYTDSNNQNVETTPTNAGTYTVTARYETATDIYTGKTTFTIGQKSLTSDMLIVSGTYTYTGAEQAVNYEVKDGNLLTANDYTITGTRGQNAGTYTVAVTGKGNYTGTVTKTWTITPAELTIESVALENRTYNGEKAVTVKSVTFNGLQNSEKLTIDTDYTATGAMTDANAGENKDVTVTVTLKDTVKNYTLKNRVYESGKVTIAKASHENVTANMEAKYGNTAELDLTTVGLPTGYVLGTPVVDTNPADIFDGSVTLSGSSLSAKLTSDATKAGKTATIKILVSSTNYADYTITVTVTVAAKDVQTITASDISATYGDTGVKVNATAVGALNYRVISGDDVIDIDASGNVTIKKAGQAKIKISAAETNDYAAATKEITVNIAKRPLTVKADDKTAYIGDKQPELTYTVSGLVGNDKLTPVPTLKLVHDANVDPMKQAGTYVIGFETEPAASANYELSAQTGTLTVSARPSYVGPTGNAVSVDRTENGKISVSPSYAAKGATVTITVTPDKGQELKSLEVIDQNGNSLSLTDLGNGKFSFVMPAGKVTVKPVFGAADAYRNPYADVQTNDWYFGAVQYVTENGLMNGTGNGFEPNLATSRAMIWTILARMSDVNTASSGEWYAVAQQWAIANGVSDGTMPNGTITREQLAAMLYRYAVSKGMVKGPATADLSVFADANSVSSYAVEAMQWAVSAGLISGMDGKLNPQGSATRAQVATMLMRFAELAK